MTAQKRFIGYNLNVAIPNALMFSKTTDILTPFRRSQFACCNLWSSWHLGRINGTLVILGTLDVLLAPWAFRWRWATWAPWAYYWHLGHSDDVGHPGHLYIRRLALFIVIVVRGNYGQEQRLSAAIIVPQGRYTSLSVATVCVFSGFYSETVYYLVTTTGAVWDSLNECFVA